MYFLPDPDRPRPAALPGLRRPPHRPVCRAAAQSVAPHVLPRRAIVVVLVRRPVFVAARSSSTVRRPVRRSVRVFVVRRAAQSAPGTPCAAAPPGQPRCQVRHWTTTYEQRSSSPLRRRRHRTSACVLPGVLPGFVHGVHPGVLHGRRLLCPPPRCSSTPAYLNLLCRRPAGRVLCLSRAARFPDPFRDPGCCCVTASARRRQGRRGCCRRC